MKRMTDCKVRLDERTEYNLLLLKIYTGPLMSAISGVDIALWGIAGKRAGMPVYRLPGGAYLARHPGIREPRPRPRFYL
jgi:L-alanine-DL-glutamate epimerase-like enolase superfamily enzyme